MNLGRKKLWEERRWSLTQAFVILVISVIANQIVDYCKTRFVRSDIRGYVLSPGIFGDHIELRLAFVNQGNRQGAIISTQPIYPFELKDVPNVRGTAYVGQRSQDFSASGVPVVLNPGEVRLVTLKGKMNIETVSLNAQPVDPKGPDADPSKPNLRKQEIQLHVHALDFRGRNYHTYWPMGTLYISDKQWSSFRLPAQYDENEIRLFDKRGYSPGPWFAPDSVPEEFIDERKQAVRPSPTPTATGVPE